MITIDFAHNDYLQCLAELGAPAFLAGLLFMLGIFRHAVRSAMNESSNDSRYVSLACAGSFAAIGIHSLVDFNLYIPANAMLLAWIAGISAAPRGQTPFFAAKNGCLSPNFRQPPMPSPRDLVWPVAMGAAIVLTITAAHSLL